MSYNFADDEYSEDDEVQLIMGDPVCGGRSISIGFKSPDGKVVSLAFDGGAGRSIKGEHCTAYRVYSDCPVIDGDEKQYQMSRTVVRDLRDALNKLNLGD